MTDIHIDINFSLVLIFSLTHLLAILLEGIYSHWLSLTLLGPMEFPIELHTKKSRWSIVYIEGVQIIIEPRRAERVLNVINDVTRY